MTDENVAFALGQEEHLTGVAGWGQQLQSRKRAAYWACGIGIFVSWNIGVVIGALAGSVITDTDVFGLDAAFPAVLLALVLPAVRDRSTRTAALVGSGVALVATPFLPAGLPVLLALVGLLFYRPAAKPIQELVG